jgi:serine/threonine protein phosphatase PrpC
MSSIAHGPEVVAARSSVALLERQDAIVPWAAVTDPGPARPHNEDRWQTDDAHGVFALADGMGGYSAGEVAGEIAVRTVAELVGALHEAGLPIRDALERAVAAAHAGIVEYAHARPECLGMGTTLVAAAIRDGRLTVAHVGDSRAYLMRGGQLRRITADHSIGQQMLEAGHLSQAQVRRLPARGILTRALGIESEPPLADVAVLDWIAGDVLLLCSDGLTDSLDDRALAEVLGRAGFGLADAARDLMAAALAAGCTDNVTVLIAGGARAAALNH